MNKNIKLVPIEYLITLPNQLDGVKKINVTGFLIAFDFPAKICIRQDMVKGIIKADELTTGFSLGRHKSWEKLSMYDALPQIYDFVKSLIDNGKWAEAVTKAHTFLESASPMNDEKSDRVSSIKPKESK